MYRFFSGGSDAEFDFYQAAAAAGITAEDVIARAGRELDAATGVAGQQTITSATAADITALGAVDFVVRTGYVAYVHLFVPWMVAVDLTQAVVSIADAAGVPKAYGVNGALYAANIYGGVHARERIDVPGTYSRKAMAAKISGAANFVINPGAGATTVPSLTVVEFAVPLA